MSKAKNSNVTAEAQRTQREKNKKNILLFLLKPKKAI